MYLRVALWLVVSVVCAGQNGTSRPRLADLGGFSAGRVSDPGRISFEGTTLAILIGYAYNVNREQISGPGWLDSEWYAITATVRL